MRPHHKPTLAESRRSPAGYRLEKQHQLVQQSSPSVPGDRFRYLAATAPALVLRTPCSSGLCCNSETSPAAARTAGRSFCWRCCIVAAASAGLYEHDTISKLEPLTREPSDCHCEQRTVAMTTPSEMVWRCQEQWNAAGKCKRGQLHCIHGGLLETRVQVAEAQLVDPKLLALFMTFASTRAPRPRTEAFDGVRGRGASNRTSISCHCVHPPCR
jgi:hypothetical protein